MNDVLKKLRNTNTQMYLTRLSHVLSIILLKFWILLIKVVTSSMHNLFTAGVGYHLLILLVCRSWFLFHLDLYRCRGCIDLRGNLLVYFWYLQVTWTKITWKKCIKMSELMVVLIVIRLSVSLVGGYIISPFQFHLSPQKCYEPSYMTSLCKLYLSV